MNQQISELLKQVAGTVVDFFVKYSFQVIGGIIILLVGLKISQWAANSFTKLCKKKNFDPTLTQFAAGAVRVVIMAFAVLVALEKFGITITPLIAAGSALLFGGSFAIQGTLANYAAGLSIIIGRPFKVGDTIHVVDVNGVVEEVKLACTVLSSGDGERITVPNKHIVGEVIYNSRENKVVELVVGISYSSDPEKAIRIIQEQLRQFPQIVATPASHAGIDSFGDSAVNIQLRYWVPTRKYNDIRYGVNMAVYKAFQQGGIVIPFPQHDVHIIDK